MEANCLSVMRAVWPGRTDANFVAIGKSVCDLLDSEETSDQLAALLTSAAVNDAGTKVIVRASDLTYCPTRDDAVPPQQGESETRSPSPAWPSVRRGTKLKYPE
jgi:hypothetical protein